MLSLEERLDTERYAKETYYNNPFNCDGQHYSRSHLLRQKEMYMRKGVKSFHMEEVWDLLWVVPNSKIRTNEWKQQEGMSCGIHVKTTLGIITTER